MKLFLAYLFFLILFFSHLAPVGASFNPSEVPNNKVGIHILFPSEIDEVAPLVNGKNGAWGYVTIPIQSGDKDIEKWQQFMDKAKEKQLIPIIRLATEGDYFNTKVWRIPTESDILDFANFLSSLTWPIENKYIVVFNEVNRGDEWGGSLDPIGYAKLLSYTVSVFKSIDKDFFIISAGLDNASITVPGVYMHPFEYYREMNRGVPGIFAQVDGFSSHSYPNPAFSKPPTIQDRVSIATFRFERELMYSLSGKLLPVFITETGWSEEKVSREKIAAYFLTAFQSVWNEKEVIAVTPFLLRAHAGPFETFSFLDSTGNPKPVYTALANLEKEKGMPKIVSNDSEKEKVLSEVQSLKPQTAQLAFSLEPFKTILKWLFKL